MRGWQKVVARHAMPLFFITKHVFFEKPVWFKPVRVWIYPGLEEYFFSERIFAGIRE